MTEIYLEPLDTRETISRPDVAADLCSRIFDALISRSDMRGVDAFTSYSASISISLRLMDVDTTEINQAVAIGDFDPAAPVEKIALDVPATDAGTARERCGLEPPNFEKDAANTSAKPKRWYTPRAAKANSRVS